MVEQTIRPKRWPRDVDFTATCRYSKTLTGDRRASIQVSGPHQTDLKIEKQTIPVCGNVRIAEITDSTHPACGQSGLFATKRLPPDSCIILYTGMIHGTEDTDVSSDFDLSLDREKDLAIDAKKAGNEARFINDYRGVSPSGPNAQFQDCRVDVGNGTLEKRIAVYVMPAGKSQRKAKGIAKGEEILVSYGKPFWRSS